MYDNINAKGELTLVLNKENGEQVEYHFKNLVVTTGLTYICSRMKDASATAMSHMAIGSSSTAPALGQTTLVTELARVALTSTTPTANTISYVAFFPAGTGTGSINEAGLFNDPAAGTMLCRSLFGATIPKGAGDTLTVTWTITLS